jgi:beta-1,4-N-acetylglucosaminyltransferase
MKLLVTVGTSLFDSLIKAVDTQIDGNDYQVTCQIGVGKYQPVNHARISFSNEFDALLEDADIVIAHAGAGTIFKLLEMGKKILVVPNLERVDKHQSDLAEFVSTSGYGIVCLDLTKLAEHLQEAIEFKANKYQKDAFFMADEIISYFTS